MRRWPLRILVGLFGLIVVTVLRGATYQWLATRKDLAAAPDNSGRLAALTVDHTLRPDALSRRA